MSATLITKTASGRFSCKFCPSLTFNTRSEAWKHCSTHLPRPSCPICDKEFSRNGALYRHIKDRVCTSQDARPEGSKRPARRSLNRIEEDSPDPIVPEGATEQEETAYNDNWPRIRTFMKRDRLCRTYNLRLPENNLLGFSQFMNRVHAEQLNPYKVNVEYGFLRKHKITGDIVYFYASHNTAAWPEPLTVTNQTDKDQVVDKVVNTSPEIVLYGNRPSTSWEMHRVTNVTVKVYPLRQYPLVGNDFLDDGAEDADEDQQPDPRIAEYIRRSKSVRSLKLDTNANPYPGNLCFFRALADLQRGPGPIQSVRAQSEALLARWSERKGVDYTVQNFPGTSFDDLDELERLFECDIYVYELFSRVEAEEPDDDEEELIENAEARERQNNENIRELLADAEDQLGQPLPRPPTPFDLRSDDEDSLDDFIVQDRPNQDLILSSPDQPNEAPTPIPSPTMTFTPPNLPLPDSSPAPQLSPQPSTSRYSPSTHTSPPHLSQPPAMTPPPDLVLPSPVPSEDDIPEIEARMVRRSPGNHSPNRLDLLIHDNHFYRITKLNTLCKAWRCERCNKYFNHHGTWDRHQRNCTESTRKIYPGGGFALPRTVFDQLAREGYKRELPDGTTQVLKDQFYPYRIVFDFEARFQTLSRPNRIRKLRYVKKLVPMSVSVTSNFPGEYSQTKHFVNKDPKVLMRDFYSYIHQCSGAIGAAMAEEYAAELAYVGEKAREVKQAKRELRTVGRQNEDAANELRMKIGNGSHWISLDRSLKRWVHQVPVLGYNSGKFDLNLARRYLLPHIVRSGESVYSIIEKGTGYMAMAMDRMIFLDMMNYVAPGMSLRQFIECYNTDPEGEGKGIFPYEYIDDYAKLDEPQLPPKEAFHSTLRNTDISDEDYQHLQAKWQTEGWTCLRDMLRWYNDLDVAPFLAAIDNMFGFFKESGVDMFKMGCISLPGLAMRRMFSRQTMVMPLFGKKHKEWYHLFKDNIVGGPSIVFTRVHRAGRTKIRDNKLCRKILGYDANSLYLYCTGKPMPCGFPQVYTAMEEGEEVPTSGTEGVVKEECEARIMRNVSVRMKQQNMYHRTNEHFWCLAYAKRALEDFEDKIFWHRFNGGQKMFVAKDGSRMWVDLWLPQLNTVVEHYGCYWHGHQDCDRNKYQFERYRDFYSEEKAQEYQSFIELKAKETAERTAKLRELGLTVVEKWECESREDEVDMDLFRVFKEDYELPNHSDVYGRVYVQDILDHVEDGQFFGAVECDLQAPWWDAELRSKMAELPPIFKNTEISRADVGEYMSNYMAERKILENGQTRRSLISSYHATKMLVATPLLQTLMRLGVQVTRVYKAIEYVDDEMFDFIVDEVIDARKAAEANDHGSERERRIAKAKGATAKLTGNSCYGKCLTNQDKHCDICLLCGREAEAAINSPLFRKLDRVEDDIYLVHSAKRKIIYNLPITVAFFVYAYAKQRMLEFYYDFLIPAVGKDNFELIQMDTDSFYFACSKGNLRSAAENLALYDRLAPDFIETPETRKTPGLFKPECEAVDMVAVCSKSYIAQLDPNDPSKVKVSSKGISHTTNDLNIRQYLGVVLGETEAVTGVNHGFRRYDGGICQYEQEKNAFTHVYLKRKVLHDKIHTEPLEL